jgi:hypothetical protein
MHRHRSVRAAVVQKRKRPGQRNVSGIIERLYEAAGYCVSAARYLTYLSDFDTHPHT